MTKKHIAQTILSLTIAMPTIIPSSLHAMDINSENQKMAQILLSLTDIPTTIPSNVQAIDANIEGQQEEIFGSFEKQVDNLEKTITMWKNQYPNLFTNFVQDAKVFTKSLENITSEFLKEQINSYVVKKQQETDKSPKENSAEAVEAFVEYLDDSWNDFLKVKESPEINQKPSSNPHFTPRNLYWFRSVLSDAFDNVNLKDHKDVLRESLKCIKTRKEYFFSFFSIKYILSLNNNPINTSKKLRNIFHFFEKLNPLTQNNAFALACMGFYGFEKQAPNDNDKKKYFDYLMHSVKTTDLEIPSQSYFLLGIFSEIGFGCPKNDLCAEKYYEKEKGGGFLGFHKSLLTHDNKNFLNTVMFELASDLEKFEIKHIAYSLGALYENGIGCKQDFKKAFEYYTKAAELGEARAMTNLGVCYEYGRGCAKNLKKAFEYYTKAANLGNARAMNNLGFCYQEGIGCEQDSKKAFGWYTKAAKLKDARAMTNLGTLYESGRGCEQDSKKAFGCYTEAAKLKHARAIANLGICYQYGIGCRQDSKKALEYYTEAANLGDALAMLNLGVCYDGGIGCEQDFKKAFEWYTKAAKLKDATAMNNLGICYKNGIGCEQDSKKAFEWYTKAAELGDVRAMSNLSNCYQEGIGCRKDTNKALEWHKKAMGVNVEVQIKRPLEERQINQNKKSKKDKEGDNN